MAGVVLAAAAGTLGARAADPNAAADGYRYEAMSAAAPLPTDDESPRFDNFEQQASAGSAQGIADYQLTIVNPPDEAAVFNDNGDVPVRATVMPDLAQGDQVELLVDGLPAAPASTALEFPLAGILPGPHRLQARILDATGNVRSVSPSIAFDVWQESLLLSTGRER